MYIIHVCAILHVSLYIPAWMLSNCRTKLGKAQSKRNYFCVKYGAAVSMVNSVIAPPTSCRHCGRDPSSVWGQSGHDSLWSRNWRDSGWNREEDQRRVTQLQGRGERVRGERERDHKRE